MKNNIILLLLIAAIGCGFSGELLAKKKTKGKIQIDPKLYVVKRADFEGRGAKRIDRIGSPLSAGRDPFPNDLPFAEALGN